MSYRISDVLNTVSRLKGDCPGAHLDWQDYGFGLRAARNDRSDGIIVFQPERADIGQPEIVTPYEEVIDFLRS